MKKIIMAMLFLSIAGTASAEMGWVEPYQRKNGDIVSGHYKDTSHDGNPYNNRKAVLGY